MTNFYMMVGMPASGKSYYSANRIAFCEVVSSDAIRKELFGDENDQEHNNEVFNEVHKRIYNLVKEGKDCCYDATNISRKRRKSFLKTLPEGTVKHAILIATDLSVCAERNLMRDRTVPRNVIDRMFKHITIPTLEEGFDYIHIVPKCNDENDLNYFLEMSEGFDQDNPHHKHTLQDHMLETYKYIINNLDKFGLEYGEINILTEAARLHDVGKYVCKTYETYSGKIDDHAHYYNHAEVGAYLYLATMPENVIITKECRFPNYETFVAELIRCHMMFFEDGFSIDRLKETHGDRFVKLLNILHEADRSAH